MTTRRYTRCAQRSMRRRQRSMKFAMILAALQSTHHLAVGFQNCDHGGRRIGYNEQQRHASSSPLFATQEFGDVISSSSSSPFGGAANTELWLDLRPTAIHPKAAMDQLESLLGTSAFVNRIVLSDGMFQNMVDYSDMYLMANQILYHDKANDEIFFSTGRGLSFPFGRFQTSPPDSALVVEDPIQAIELITTGKWLFLGIDEQDADDDDRETTRMNAVGDFLDIASTTMSSLGGWGSSDENSGLILPSSAGSDSGADDHTVGGIAVQCTTKSAVMQLASTLQFTHAGASATSMSDSGIIVQQSNANDEESENSLCTAAVLPLEVEVWQVALLVFGVEGLAETEL